MRYECIVIGGGAAGMIAAITAATNGISTAIIEHTDRVGKKILQTGNGRCNLTNMRMNESCYHNDDSAFTMQVINSFSVSKTIEFFKNLGIYPKSRDGYIYPNSDMAASVLDVLRLELERQNINVILKTNIKSIRSNHNNKNQGNFRIQTDNDVYECTSLIMATGSKAAPKTGSDGSGYQYAQNLGHTIIEPLPALVQLRSNLSVCKLMAGVRSEGKVSLYVNNKIVSEDTGEVQFTDYGLSGIPIFQISRYAVRAVANQQKVEVRIDMLPSMSKDDILALIFDRLRTDGYKNIEQFFMGMINKKLIGSVAKVADLNINDRVQGLGHDTIESIVDIMKEFIVPIDGYNSFEQGQICSGGVKLTEVHPETMESKIVSNLYFAGEVLDVDGICGGYNLQWAWSSGHLAGVSAARNNEVS